MEMKKEVWVFGGGVAGLSAAHELAERGFVVHVVEKRPDPRDPSLPLLGGMAATQYRRWPTIANSSLRVPGDERMRRAAPLTFLKKPADAKGPTYLASTDRVGRWPLFNKTTIDDAVNRLMRLMHESPTRREEVWVLGPDASATGKDSISTLLRDGMVERLTRDLEWECQVVREPKEKKDSAATSDDEGLRTPSGAWPRLGVSSFRYDLENKKDKQRLRIGFASYDGPPLPDSRCALVVREELLAGEHGYRFFPSFYRNLFDTMQRIPILREAIPDPLFNRIIEVYAPTSDETAKGYIPTNETAYSRIVSMPRHAIATFDGRAPLELSRGEETSVASWQSIIGGVMDRLKLTHRDLAQAQLKMLRYATSSRGRRSEYEHMTWEDFIEASKCSETFRETMRHWAQALVGLVSNRADARSFGSVQLQLQLDQARKDGLRDGSLDAPTTEAWFDHWRTHLSDNLNVAFLVGELLDLIPSSKKKPIGCIARWKRLEDGAVVPTAADHYIVVALDIGGAIGFAEQTHRALAGTPLAASTASESDSPLAALSSLASEHPDLHDTRRANVATVKEDRPVADYAGIQFFLEEEHYVLRGHIYYPDSPWRLTSVAPTAYRRARPDYRLRAPGLVSVIIGDWDTRIPDGPTARECSADELAHETWKQIREALRGTETPPPEWPLAYHIDESIEFGDDEFDDESTREKGIVRNATRFLLNDVGLADWWPEQPGNYGLHHERVAFAGNWLRTHTRLVTMESACESGRHAANAILDDYAAEHPNSGYGRIPVFDLEDSEPADLAWLKRLDSELVQRGLPHLFDILDIEGNGMRLLGNDGALDLGSAIRDQLRDTNELGGRVGDALRSMLAAWPSFASVGVKKGGKA